MNNQLLDLMADALGRSPPANRLLVSHHNDAMLTGALHGNFSSVWWRTAGPEIPSTWPAGGQYDEVILPLPRGKEALRFCLNAAATALKAGGGLWLFGLNDLGIKSADKQLAEFFTMVEPAATGGHGRVWKASGLRAGIGQSLQQLQSKSMLQVAGEACSLVNYPGLFAGGKLDEGTELLLSALADVPASVLDFACGLGVIALACKKANPHAQITVADNDPLAVLAATQNVAGSTGLLTALPTDLTGTYDLIVSNPPIHQGDTQSFQIVDLLIRELPRLLKPKGRALLVAQVTVPIARLASMHKLKAEEVAASRSFRVSCISR